MIVEQRTYDIRVGRIAEFVDYFEHHDLPFIVPIMGEPVGWYTTEFGLLNQVVQMWLFEDYVDRQRRRALVAAHPAYPAHIATLSRLIVSQSSTVLLPAPFFARQLTNRRSVAPAGPS